MPEYESIASTLLLQTVNIRLIDFLIITNRSFFFKEIVVLVWLATELSLRVWSAGCCSRYQALIGRLRFLRKPFCALGLHFTKN